jgi:hypothetical protein
VAVRNYPYLWRAGLAIVISVTLFYIDRETPDLAHVFLGRGGLNSVVVLLFALPIWVVLEVASVAIHSLGRLADRQLGSASSMLSSDLLPSGQNPIFSEPLLRTDDVPYPQERLHQPE